MIEENWGLFGSGRGSFRTPAAHHWGTLRLISAGVQNRSAAGESSLPTQTAQNCISELESAPGSCHSHASFQTLRDSVCNLRVHAVNTLCLAKSVILESGPAGTNASISTYSECASEGACGNLEQTVRSSGVATVSGKTAQTCPPFCKPVTLARIGPGGAAAAGVVRSRCSGEDAALPSAACSVPSLPALPCVVITSPAEERLVRPGALTCCVSLNS